VVGKQGKDRRGKRRMYDGKRGRKKRITFYILNNLYIY